MSRTGGVDTALGEVGGDETPKWRNEISPEMSQAKDQDRVKGKGGIKKNIEANIVMKQTSRRWGKKIPRVSREGNRLVLVPSKRALKI